MAITARTSGTGTATGTSTAISITRPSGIASGDLVVALINHDANSTIADNNGSTPFHIVRTDIVDPGAPDLSGTIAVRVAGSSEPASYAFTLGTSVGWSIGIAAYVGADTAVDTTDYIPPFDVAITKNDNGASASTTIDLDSLTTATAGAWNLLVGMVDTNSTMSGSPSGYTTRINNATLRSLFVLDKEIASAGTATGAQTITYTPNNENVGYQLALRPATSGTSYSQSVSGTLTAAGSAIKATSRSLSGSLASAGALAKSTARSLAGSLTSAGALTRNTARSLTGTLTSSGTLSSARTAYATLTGTLTSAGTVAKQTTKTLAGALSGAGALAKQTLKSLAGAISSTGTLAKRTAKQIAGAVTSSGAFSSLLIVIRTLSGSGTASSASGTGTGLSFANVIYMLSGSATAGVATGSGAGLRLSATLANWLSGSATASPATGSGYGLYPVEEPSVWIWEDDLSNYIVITKDLAEAQGIDADTPNEAFYKVNNRFLNMGMLSVKDKGAVGDGVTNDAPAIAAAVADAIANGQTIYFPPGTYLIETTNVFGPVSADQWGLMVRGAGADKSILKLAPGAAWFYDPGAAGYGYKNPIFADIQFQGDNTSGTNGFRTSQSGWEIMFMFHRCRFYQLGTILHLNGSIQNDSHRFNNCRALEIKGKAIVLNNLNAVAIDLTGSRIELAHDDIFHVDYDTASGSGGGTSVNVQGGSYILGATTGSLAAPSYLLHVESSPVATGIFNFNGIRTELRDINARLVWIEAPATVVSGGTVQVVFTASDFTTVLGALRDAVNVHASNKSVHFQNCRLSDRFSYRFNGNDSDNWAAGLQGVPGQITFRDSSVPRGIWQSIVADATNPYAVLQVEQCFRERANQTLNISSIEGSGTTVTVITAGTHGLGNGEYVQIEGTTTFDGIHGPITVDVSEGLTGSSRFTYPSAATGSSLGAGTDRMRYVDAAIDGRRGIGTGSGMNAGTFVKRMAIRFWSDVVDDLPNSRSSERYCLLPPNAVITALRLRKTARGALVGNTVQQRLGTNDKATIYASSTAADQNADHSITATGLAIHTGTALNTRIVRLWLTASVGSVGQQDKLPVEGEYAIIEYL